MTTACTKCGAALTERDSFCTKCGAPRAAASEISVTQRFCTNCGAPLAAETKFCTKCGALAGSPSADRSTTIVSTSDAVGKSALGARSDAPAETAPLIATSATAGTTSSAPIPKIAVVILGMAVVMIIAVVSGFIYTAHRVRQKIADREAAANFEKSVENLKANANSGPQNGDKQIPPDVDKSLSDAAAAINALSALAQNANKQTGAGANNNPLSAIPGFGGASPTSSPPPNSAPAPGSPAAIAAASAAADAALAPPPIPGADVPMVPVAATGNQAHDWALEYERTVGGPDADLVVRTGDINNLGFGWPPGFDPFSGQSTPVHPGPNMDHLPPKAPPGTDRVILGTGLTSVHMSIQHTAGKPDQIMVDALTKTIGGDGYSWSIAYCDMIRDRLRPKIGDQTTNSIQLPPGVSRDILQVAPYDAAKCTRARQLTMPTPIVLLVGALPPKINAVVFQIFADDFQAPVYSSHFQLSLNGTRIPSFEYAINSLNQSGPIGKLVTLKLLPEYWPLLKSGTVKLLIDDPTTHKQDGYAVDFVRILVNPHNFKYQVSLSAHVTDAEKNTPIADATVTAGLESAPTDKAGKCELKGIPAGLVVATANAPGYDENSVPVDLPAGQSGNADIQLHRHQESTAALEQSIAQTGTATVYGIHFDTDSSKIRGDSIPALNAVLGLINNRPSSRWIISGHTDNQGSDKLNTPLSKSRAASVVSWLTGHGIAADRLEPEGFGASRPVADNATAGGRALNRRVEVALEK